MNNKPRIAAFTQCYKEHVMLPLWVKHYGNLVGYENLLILDHGNEPPLSIPNVRTEYIPRSDLDEEKRVVFLQEWQQRLLKEYDWVIFADTDEFIVLRQSNNKSLHEYLLEHPLPKTRRCVGVDVFDPGNHPSVDWSSPILAQRPIGMVTQWSCKPALSSVVTMWEPGLHQAKDILEVDHSLWLFHLKYADETHLMQRLALTRSLTWTPASIAKRYAQSHRIPDVIMQKHLQNCRSNRENQNIDDYIQAKPDFYNHTSALLNIPEDLIHSL